MLAHQGGWDEVLMVAAPILVMVGLLVLATRRARHLPPPDADGPNRDGQDSDGQDSDGPQGDEPGGLS